MAKLAGLEGARRLRVAGLPSDTASRHRRSLPLPLQNARKPPLAERLVGAGGKPARLLDSSEVQDATANWYAVKATTHPSNNRLGAFATRSHLAARLVRQQRKAAPTLMIVNAASAEVTQ